MKKLFPFVLILTLLMTIGCTIDESNEISEFDESTLSLLEILSDDALITSKRPKPPIWADCYKFSGIVVPATFKNKGPFDELYAIPDDSGNPTPMFKEGFPLISDSKPGDQDYNGGRWHMNVLKSDVPSDKYLNACSVEDLDLNDFWSTDTYFECPLIKYKN